MRTTRRTHLHQLAAAALAGLAGRSRAAGPARKGFRLAVCNELFGELPFRDACRAAKAAGYAGVEVMPATLADDPANLPAGRRKQLRAVLADEGLECVGLHFLLKAPRGLHLTTPEAARRRRSWATFRRLIDLCADLGGSRLVLGSGKERGTTGGATAAEATARLRDGLADLAAPARERGCLLLLEALGTAFTDVVTTLAEAVAIVRQIDHPAVQSMFDFKNARDETRPHAELVRTHFRHIRHVHLNEMDGRHPGTGKYDYRPVLQVLKDEGYDGWLSLEVFDFTGGGPKIAAEAARYLRGVEAGLG